MLNREALLAEAESLFASIPSPVALTKSSPRPVSTCQDPRQTDPRRRLSGEPSPEQKRRIARIEMLTKELGMDDNNGKEMTPEKAMKLMQNPKFQELQKLAIAMSQESTPPGYDAWNRSLLAYDAKTKSWLAASGWRSVPGFTGKATLIEYNSARAERIVAVEFTTTKAYFVTGAGRLCFSGGCTLRASSGNSPEVRTYPRPNPAVTQLYIGQEGYVLKFQAIKVNNEARPQPMISLGILSAHLDGLPTVLGDPGEPVYAQDGKTLKIVGTILGYPFAGKEKAQRGAVVWPDHARPSYSWKAAWDFKPV
jgi:hypothetical protein